jgi:hypothetical protein
MSTPALTLWRPWTTCITGGPGSRGIEEQLAKRVENRTWATRYRGELWLHAGTRFDDAAFDWLYDTIVGAYLSSDPADHPTGVVALVDVVDVCTRQLDQGAGIDFFGKTCCGDWAAAGQAHWNFTNVRVLPEPVPCRGGQRLWRLPADVEAACRAQLTATGVGVS